MEENLYDIEIHKSEGKYHGKLFSDSDGIKEFKNERLDKLLRDISIDMQLALAEYNSRLNEFTESRVE